MGALSPRKGARYERKCVRFLNEIFGSGTFSRDPAKLEPSGRATGADLEGSVSGAVCVVQCKKGKRPSVWRAVREAESASTCELDIPMAIVEKDRDGSPLPEPVVCMRPDAFRNLVEALSCAKAE